MDLERSYDSEDYSKTNLSLIWNLKNNDSSYNLRALSTFIIHADYENSCLPYNFSTPSHEDNNHNSFKIGFIYGFFNNRFSGSLNYTKNNFDFLLPVKKADNKPTGFNTVTIYKDIEVSSKTLSYALDAKIINTNDFKWNLSTNITYSENEVSKLEGGPILLGGRIIKKGQALNTFNLRKQYYNSYGDPVYGKYVSSFGSVVEYNLADRIPSESSDPKYVIGLNSSIRFKNWDFSFSGRAHTGNYVYNQIAADSYYNILKNGGFNIPKYVLDTDFNSSNKTSDIYLRNASFFRMDYISLGYNFNPIFKKKVGINLSATIQNAFVWTSYKGQDPETTNGIDGYSFPRPRIYSLSLKLAFK